MSPRMLIIAGPPGSGKSTAFPVSGFGVDFFNADDHAAALNRGSYLEIPREIRGQVNRLFETFVADHIERRVSFAFETTLRSAITFEQAVAAHTVGFVIEMRYLALQTFEMNLERIKMRADMGGHSASDSVLRQIWRSSIANLGRAIREMDFVSVYENSRWGITPAVPLQAERGEIVYRADQLPAWLTTALL
jgi:predicted ABC-type ATPase